MTYFIEILFSEILSREPYTLELDIRGRWSIENQHGLICWSGDIGKCDPTTQTNRTNKIIKSFLRRD